MGCVQVGLLLLCVFVTCEARCKYWSGWDCGECSCRSQQLCKRYGIRGCRGEEVKTMFCYGGYDHRRCPEWETWGQWSPTCDCHMRQQHRTRNNHECCTGPSSQTQTRNCPPIDCINGDNGCRSRGGHCQPAGDRCIGGYNPVKGLCRDEPCCKCCKGCELSQWTRWTRWSYGDCTPTCSRTGYGTQTCTSSRSRTKCHEDQRQNRSMTRRCKVPHCGCDCKPWSLWENDCDDCACQPDGTKKHECRRHREHCDDCDGDDHESRRGPCFLHCDCRGEWMPWVGKCTRERRRGKGTCPGPRVVEERSCSAP